jgi:hypothetical protein
MLDVFFAGLLVLGLSVLTLVGLLVWWLTR